MLDNKGEDVPRCEKCGHYHIRGEVPGGARLCSGHIHSNPEKLGMPCGHVAGWGTPNQTGQCRKHGGNTPQAAKTAERKAVEKTEREVEQEVRKLLAVEGFVGIENPYEALAMLAGEVWKLKEVLLQRVEKLQTLKDSGGEQFGTQLAVEFQAYEKALDRTARLLVDIAKIDLTGKIAVMNAAVDGATAKLVKDALAGALGVVKMPLDQKDLILREFGIRLRRPDQDALEA